MSIRIKRAYLPAALSDGHRVLVDRLWPRGLSRSRLRLDAWLPGVAPSASLRKWYSHDLAKWADFKKRYFVELRSAQEGIDELVRLARRGTLTLVFSSREERYNNAAALKEYLGRRTRRPRSR
jgi:uncharacterized protein YeaO (DUF488 family)